jgi:hypothetical protein
MAQVQEKMKDCLEKQTVSIDSLQRLSAALHNTNTNMSVDDEDHDSTVMVAGDKVEDEEEELEEETTRSNLSHQQLVDAKKLRGMNIAPKSTIHKKSNRRSKYYGIQGEKKAIKEKRRPRYFVQF